MRLYLFVFTFCALVGLSIGAYNVFESNNPSNKLNVLVFQTKDRLGLFDIPAAHRIIEKILHEKIQLHRVETIEELKKKLIKDSGNKYDLVYLDMQSFKILQAEGLTEYWKASFDDQILNEILLTNSNSNKASNININETVASDKNTFEEVSFLPLFWAHQEINDIQKCTKQNMKFKTPFFIDGFTISHKSSAHKIEIITDKVEKLIIHPAFQKIISNLPYGFTIQDKYLDDQILKNISKERLSSHLKEIPLSERTTEPVKTH